MKKIWKQAGIGLLSWCFLLSMTGIAPLYAEEKEPSDSDLSYSESEESASYIEDPELDGAPIIDYTQSDLSDVEAENEKIPAEEGAEIEESYENKTVDYSTAHMETKTLTSTEAEIIVQYECDNPKQTIPVTLLSDGEMIVLSSGYSNNGEQIASFASTGTKSMEVTLTEKGMQFLQAGNVLPIGLKIRNAAGLNKIELQVSELLKLSRSWSSSGSTGGSDGELTGISNKESQVQPLTGSATDKINQLKQMFPQNTYWNHKGSEGDDYNPESVTSHPCSDHSTSDLTTGEYRCNVFDTGFRCDGFAFICYYKFNGVYFTDSRATQEVSGSAGLKVGDIIYTQTAQDSAGGHYAFVQGISGNTVYKLEANYAGNCRIWHSASVQKSDIVSHWTRKPVNLRYDANGGSGTMENRTFLYGDSFGLDNIGFYKNGYQFGGWELRKADTKDYVYTNG